MIGKINMKKYVKSMNKDSKFMKKKNFILNKKYKKRCKSIKNYKTKKD